MYRQNHVQAKPRAGITIYHLVQWWLEVEELAISCVQGLQLGEKLVVS